MRRAACVAVTVMLLTSGACRGRPPTMQEVADLATRSGDAVWKVVAEGCGWKSVGSAFAIDDRHLVTNHHVIANDSSPLVTSRTGKALKGRVIGSLTYPDVAVVEVSEDVDPTLEWSDEGSLEKTDPLVVIGYPGPKHEFTAAAGQVVGFYGTTREAALTNTPIAKGNSGGPGVTPDEGVAGIVTLMRLRADPKDRVAIMFTADAIRDRVASFIAKPKDVLSSCGLGPDYVPSVPKTFDIGSPPPTVAPITETAAPAPPTFTPLGTPTRRTAAPLPPASTPEPTDTPQPACPTGSPTTSVGSVESSESAQGSGWWRVDARGAVTNDASYAIWLRDISVTVEQETRSLFPPQETMQPGDDVPWRFYGDVYSPGHQPDQGSVTVALDWRWSEGNYDWCPTA